MSQFGRKAVEREQGEPHPHWEERDERFKAFLDTYELASNLRIQVQFDEENTPLNALWCFYRDWREDAKSEIGFVRSLNFHGNEEEFEKEIQFLRKYCHDRNFIFSKP